MTDSPRTDFDYIVIGSGFGGSVSALRLAQKGYKVAVLEKAKSGKPGIFPKPTGGSINTCGFRRLGAMGTRC